MLVERACKSIEDVESELEMKWWIWTTDGNMNSENWMEANRTKPHATPRKDELTCVKRKMMFLSQ